MDEPSQGQLQNETGNDASENEDRNADEETTNDTRANENPKMSQPESISDMILDTFQGPYK